MKFSIKDFFTFTEEILNGKLHFLYSERRGVQKEKLINTPYKSITNTAVEEHFSSGNKYSAIVANDEKGTKVPSNSS